MTRGHKKKHPREGDHQTEPSGPQISSSYRPPKINKSVPPRPPSSIPQPGHDVRSTSPLSNGYNPPHHGATAPPPPHPFPPSPPQFHPQTGQRDNDWVGDEGYQRPLHSTATTSSTPYRFGDDNQPVAPFQFDLRATVILPRPQPSFAQPRDGIISELQYKLSRKEDETARQQQIIQQLQGTVEMQKLEISVLRLRESRKDDVLRAVSPEKELSASQANLAPAKLPKKTSNKRKKTAAKKNTTQAHYDGHCRCCVGFEERFKAAEKPPKWQTAAPCGKCSCCTSAQLKHVEDHLPVTVVDVPELDPWTMTRVLTPRSEVRNREDTYETLEWVGDRVLEVFGVLLVTGHGAMPLVSRPHRNPLKETLVRNTTLAIFSSAYGLPGQLLQPDPTAFVQMKTKADMFEALIGGICIDCGWNAALRFLEAAFVPAALWLQKEYDFGRLVGDPCSET